MIARIAGKFIEKKKNSVVIENGGIFYEVFLPVITLANVESFLTTDGNLNFMTYHYHHVEPSRSIPVLIGFANETEKEFFEEFITVSGIGPKAALRAINAPISIIAKAIDEADLSFLRSMPGIGPQRAKEIVAKLQNKIGRFGLLQDSHAKAQNPAHSDLMEEAIAVLMQLQYKKNEARDMVQDALKKQPQLKNIEELLNIVYKQKIKR